MSISNPTTNVDNPISAYVKFKGDSGKIEYSPRNKEEPEVFYDYDKLSFVVLDDTVGAVTGYKKEPLSSNKIRAMDMEAILNVFLGKSLIATGKWKDIKDKVKAAGGHYTKLIYCYCLETQSIVEFSVNKGKLLKWNNFLDSLDLKTGEGVGFKLCNITEETTGNTTYFEYEFKGKKVETDTILQIAKELDIKLQTYLNTIINGKQSH